MTQSHQAYINNVRQNVRLLWNALHALRDAQTQWNALVYGNTLESTVENVTPADVGAAVFATPDAIFNLLSQGHATNLSKLL